MNLLLIVFIFISLSTESDAKNVYKKCAKLRTKMEVLDYVLDVEFNEGNINESKSINNFLISIHHGTIGEGNFAKVYIGYKGTKEEEFSAEKCVAIRISPGWKNLEGEKFVNTAREMRKKLSKNERTGIIEIIDIGRLVDKHNYVTIMELGQKNYKNELNRTYIDVDYDNDMMKNEIVKIVTPLVDFHKFAIHLDVIPSNYVQVGTGNNKVLKLIDFGSSELIKGEIDESEKANHPIAPFWNDRSDPFAGPEFGLRDKDSIRVTTKTDIWSVGIVIYELFLAKIFADIKEEERKILLEKISNTYRGFHEVFTDIMMRENRPIVYEEKWLIGNADAVLAILEMRRLFPVIFILLQNILQLESAHRMTASGILNFLAGNCKPPFMDQLEEMILFANINKIELLTLVSNGLSISSNSQFKDDIHVKLEKIQNSLVGDGENENFLVEFEKLSKISEVCAH